MSNEVKSDAQDVKKEQSTSSVQIPSTKELLKAGSQFGHETKRWNPKMQKYIYGEKNRIHIIDIDKTEEGLKKAVEFLKDAASKGNVLFVGTKRQASDLIKDEAIRAGAYFINVRWAGGLLTNFPVVRKSLAKLNELEKGFEEGIENRTKFEVSRMKKEWLRLNRLYSGIKELSAKPTAVVIVDTNYEKSAVKECRKIRVPIIGLVDTNSDPDNADYVIPANDDAIGSLSLILKALGDSVLAGNRGNGVKHKLTDYSKVEVKIKQKEAREEEAQNVTFDMGQMKSEAKVEEAPTKSPRSRTKVKGILEQAKEQKTEAKKAPAKKVEKKEKPVKKEAAPKKAAAKKPAAKKAPAKKAAKK